MANILHKTCESSKKIVKNTIINEELKFRKVKRKERMKFYKLMTESSEDIIQMKGVSIKFLKFFILVDRFLLGIPFKIITKANKIIIDDFFVEKHGEIVAGYSLVYEKEEDRYVLGNLFTRSKYQGQGIANIILQTLILNIVDKTIILEVNKENEVALHLYRKYGFIEQATIEEYLFDLPLETKPFPQGYNARILKMDDLENLHRVINEIPKMQDLPRIYKKTMNKAKKRFYRIENQFSAVLFKDNEILGVGRATWTKLTPHTANIIATAILDEAKEAYPCFIEFITNQIDKYKIKKCYWSRNNRTERFFEQFQPFLNKPFRTGIKMELNKSK